MLRGPGQNQHSEAKGNHTMNIRRMSRVGCFWALSALVGGMIACGIPGHDEGDELTAPGSLHQSLTPICPVPLSPFKNREADRFECCDPMAGESGSTWVPQSAIAQYQYMSGWCTVGRGITPGCYGGRQVLFQTLASAVCRTTGADCTNPTAEYDVTCNALVECVYNCSGRCVPSRC